MVVANAVAGNLETGIFRVERSIESFAMRIFLADFWFVCSFVTTASLYTLFLALFPVRSSESTVGWQHEVISVLAFYVLRRVFSRKIFSDFLLFRVFQK